MCSRGTTVLTYTCPAEGKRSTRLLWPRSGPVIATRHQGVSWRFHMRLLRLMAYSLLAVAIYEFIQGIYQEPLIEQQPRRGRQKRGGGRRPVGQNISGPGEGQDVEVAGAGGTRERQRVGRGIVH